MASTCLLRSITIASNWHLMAHQFLRKASLLSDKYKNIRKFLSWKRFPDKLANKLIQKLRLGWIKRTRILTTTRKTRHKLAELILSTNLGRKYVTFIETTCVNSLFIRIGARCTTACVGNADRCLYVGLIGHSITDNKSKIYENFSYGYIEIALIKSTEKSTRHSPNV